MLKIRSIVISALCAPLLWGCGQKGDLYLPTAPEAAHRATLPQTLFGKPAATPRAAASQVLPAIASPQSNTSNLPEVGTGVNE